MSTQLSEAAQFVADLQAACLEHVASGRAPLVVFHPGFNANGVFESVGGQINFQPHGCPPGKECDRERWIADGRPLRAAHLRTKVVKLRPMEPVWPAEPAADASANDPESPPPEPAMPLINNAPPVRRPKKS